MAEFTRFFLTTCIDQVNFMEEIIMPERLLSRILLWAEEETRAGELPPRSGIIKFLIRRLFLSRNLLTLVENPEIPARKCAEFIVSFCLKWFLLSRT